MHGIKAPNLPLTAKFLSSSPKSFPARSSGEIAEEKRIAQVSGTKRESEGKEGMKKIITVIS